LEELVNDFNLLIAAACCWIISSSCWCVDSCCWIFESCCLTVFCRIVNILSIRFKRSWNMLGSFSNRRFESVHSETQMSPEHNRNIKMNGISMSTTIVNWILSQVRHRYNIILENRTDIDLFRSVCDSYLVKVGFDLQISLKGMY
jgi:hypothetical protein